MWHTETGSILLPEQARQRNLLLQYIWPYRTNGFSFIRPTRRFRLRWRSWLNVFFIGVLLILILQFILREKIGKTANFPLPNEMSYRSRHIRTPQYLLLDIDDNSRPICKQIFENIIPHIVRNNATDKDLVQSLFANKLNPTYLTHSDSNETIPIMQGKLCSNISNEWILFTILEKETLKKSTDQNAYVMDVLPDGSKKAHECVSFDFKECSVNNLQNDYPRLFQLDHEQHIKRISTHERSMPIEIVYIVYHYIRRKAVDYIEYQDKLTKINSASFNITIVPDFISFQDIRIKVKIIQNGVLFTNMDCVATLQRKNFNRIYSFQMINPIIHFDQLAPGTNYNICASCQGINKICKQIKTSSMESSINFESNHGFIYSAVVILIFLIIFVIFFTLFGRTLILFCYRQSTRSKISIDEGRGSVHSSPRTPDGISVATTTGRSVQEPRGSVSSIGSITLHGSISGENLHY